MTVSNICSGVNQSAHGSNLNYRHDAGAAARRIDAKEAKRLLELLDADQDVFLFTSLDDDKDRGQIAHECVRRVARAGKEAERLRKAAGDNSKAIDELNAEIAAIRRDMPDGTQTKLGCIDSLLKWMQRRQDAGYNVTVCVQAMKGNKRRKEDVTAFRAIFAEMDAKQLKDWPIQPSIVIETSPDRYHVYWIIDVETPMTAAVWDGVMRRIVTEYGSDPAAKDCARTMRLPGTWNLKTGRAPHLVHVVSAEGYRYSADEITEAFPPVEIKSPSTNKPNWKRFKPQGDDLDRLRAPLEEIPADEYQDWIRVGMALHAESGGSSSGLSMWDAWSARAGNYATGECEYRWGTFKSGGACNGGTILGMASDYGWRPAKDKKPVLNGKPAAKIAAKATPAPVKRDTPMAAVPAPQEIEPDEELECGETAEDESAARASCLRAILIDGYDDARLEARIRRQWPHLREKAVGLIASTKRTAANWQLGMVRRIDGAMKRITSVEKINENFVMVTIPGQASCIAQISDALFIKRDDFSARLGDSVIVAGVDKEGHVKVKDAAKLWFGDCRRRTADKVVFTARDVASNHLNLWTGFGVEPNAGCCDLICNHIREVICANRDVEYKAFINLLAWQTQNIGRASRIIVTLFSKEQQIGKGVLLEKIMPAIFGLHGVFTPSSDQIFGRFNDLLRGTVYCGLDETCFAGDRKTADKIKSTAASESMYIEGKGIPIIKLPGAVNLYLATNHEHSAHVEECDARYWILKVSPHRKNDRVYWGKLFEEIEHGGIEAFLHYLLSVDVSDFIPQRDVPIHNDEHRANQRASDPVNPIIWLADCIDNGMWVGSDKWNGRYSPDGSEKLSKGALQMENKPGGVKMLPAFLEAAYMAWAEGHGRHAQPAPKDKFWKALTDVGFVQGRTGAARYRIAPESEQILAAIERMANGQ
jgi:hypothetical protein